jgi:hypothetical protein
VDLPGAMLGQEDGGIIELDSDAAGHGWFVDPTPGDDVEFGPDGRALAGSGAAGTMDLLTVVLHELGHLLGFEHGALPFMSETLAAGVRLTPETTTEGSATWIEPAAPLAVSESGQTPPWLGTLDETSFAGRSSDAVNGRVDVPGVRLVTSPLAALAEGWGRLNFAVAAPEIAPSLALVGDRGANHLLMAQDERVVVRSEDHELASIDGWLHPAAGALRHDDTSRHVQFAIPAYAPLLDFTYRFSNVREAIVLTRR